VIDPELPASHGFEPWQSDPEFLLDVFRAFPHFCKASLTLVNQALTNALFFTVLHKNASKAYHTYVALPVKVGVGERSLLASRGAAGAIHKLMPFEVAAFSVLGRRENFRRCILDTASARRFGRPQQAGRLDIEEHAVTL
jgi:hypothetical protein